MYRFWFQLKNVVMLHDYLPQVDDDALEQQISTTMILYILSLFLQMGVMLVVTFASGYVGDAYVSNVVKSLRTKISLEDNEAVSKSTIDFLMLANFYKGEAGLLFCGVEMGTEKAFYLVTALTYINAYFITPSSS